MRVMIRVRIGAQVARGQYLSSPIQFAGIAEVALLPITHMRLTEY
jgi:hypothetical protein